MPDRLEKNIYAVQIIIVGCILIGSQYIGKLDLKWGAAVLARYVFYIYLIRLTREIIIAADKITLKRRLQYVGRLNQKHCCLFFASVTAILYLEQELIQEDFFWLFVADLITLYPNMEIQKKKISYGTGMACSFFEGYLMHVLPNDGYKFVGFEENIRVFESNESVRFPVKKLFIIATKTMYCPPDLKEFNRKNKRDLPYLEACKSLEHVQKDVAGVKNRIYRNSAYMINRRDGPPVYLAAECATPLHTLYNVLQRRAVYNELEGIDEVEIVEEFITMLKSILSKSPACHDKCEIVYFDNTNPDLNLADVLLNRIQELEPNFEEIIRLEE